MWIFSTIFTLLPSTPPSPDTKGGFEAALAFLSRLGKPAPCGIGLAWHGIAGLALGAIITLPSFLLFIAFSKLFLSPLLGALGWLALEIWLSRGLHWDAVADLGDALGSGASGAKFRAILKDSRMGAFGAMALNLGMASQWLAVAAHFAAGTWAALATLFFAPAWARLGPAWLGHGQKAREPNSLGALVCAEASRKIWILAWLQACTIAALACVAGLNAWQACLLLMSQIMLNLAFTRLAKKYGGLSGDFFGCHIEASQLAFLFLTI